MAGDSPEKAAQAYRTISEVAAEINVPQHVLRFWETRFPSLKPLKRGGNRRYYRPADVALLKSINRLLYTDGYTIKGVQKLIVDHGIGALDALTSSSAPAVVAGAAAIAAVPSPIIPAPFTGLDISALYAIRDRLAGALAEVRAA